MKHSRTISLLATGALAAVILTPGSAVAASARTVLLGRGNTVATATGITNTTGTPLVLSAGRGKAPLAVNSTTQVPRLNADLLDGQHAGAFASAKGVTGTVYGHAIDVAAVCPAGTVVTGGGGYPGADDAGVIQGALAYSGPDFDLNGNAIKNTWLALGDSNGAWSFATCYSAIGKSVAGSITPKQAVALRSLRARTLDPARTSR